MNTSGIENVCRELHKDFQEVLSWKWDGRFDMALAEFNIKNKDKIIEILTRHLGNTWEKQTINTAPDAVQSITIGMGGLRPGQLFFNSEPENGLFIFCAWWPWGDSQTISIRIAPGSSSLSPEEETEQTELLKGCFGL